MKMKMKEVERRGDGEEMLHYLHDTPPALDGESVGVFLGGRGGDRWCGKGRF